MVHASAKPSTPFSVSFFSLRGGLNQRFLSGSGTKTVAGGRTLNLGGDSTWTAGPIQLSTGGILTNQAGFTFTTNFAGTLHNSSPGAGTFNNAGTFTKSGAGTTTTIGTVTGGATVDFINTGIVNVDSGTLSLINTSSGAGLYDVDAGAALQFSGTHTPTGSITGAGNVIFSGGTTTIGGTTYALTGALTMSGGAAIIEAGSETATSMTISGGTLTLNTGTFTTPVLVQSLGTLAGSATVTTSGLFAWTGGTLSGAGVLNANGGVSFGTSGTKAVAGGRTLNLGGDSTWTAGTIQLSTGGILTNQAGFTFTTNFAGTMNNSSPGAGTFINAGTFTKSGAGTTTTIGTVTSGATVDFNNTGTVNVDSGTLALTNTSSGAGLYDVDALATLQFSGSTHTPTGSITGAGNVIFAGGTTTIGGTTYALTGALTMSGGAAIIEAGSETATSMTISGGTLTLNTGTFTTPVLVQSLGTLAGSATVTTGGLFVWTGGTLSGAGVLNANGGVSFAGGTKSINGTRTLNLGGDSTWTAGTIQISPGGILTNQAGFTLTTNFAGSVLNPTPDPTPGAGGTFNNAGTFTKSGAGTTTTIGSVTNGATLAFNNTGTVNVDSGTLSLHKVTQYSSIGTVLSGGTWVVRDGATLTFPAGTGNIIDNSGDVTLSGPTSVFVKINPLATNNGAFRLLANRNFTAGSFTNTGTLQLGGGTFAATTLANSAAGEVFGFGLITVRPTNSGTIRAAGGTLTFANGILGPGGTVQVDAGAVLDLSGGASGSSGNSLVHNGSTAGSLNLGTNSFTVAADYTNAGFGLGNSFDPRANVAGAGLILATGGIAQQLTGDVTGGATATPVSFGNVHVGDVSTRNYQIANVGASGPGLRGAIQTSVNGGNLTDARLSGAGVTAANFGPIAQGASSGNLAVTFTGTSAGALTGQTVRLLNNFDNVGDQTLSISGAVYRLANPSAHNPEPAILSNVHVGDVVTGYAPLNITNFAANDGFSEALDATIGSPTGAVTTNGGSFSLLAPGANSGALGVRITDTSSAGLKSGTATITLTSNGSGSSGLGTTALGTQTVNVTRSVFRFASASAHTPEPVNFGNRHVGAVVTQALTFTNTAANDGFSEKLNAEFDTQVSPPTGDATVGGSFSLLAPGATDSSSLAVGITTATPGNKSGTATVLLTSDGTGTSGLGTFGAGVQTVNVTGFVYSGNMKWSGSSGGAWNTGSNWTDTVAGGAQAGPGLDAGFTNVDSATFGDTAGSVTVNLSGAAPMLNAVTFDGTGSYTVAGGTALTLAGAGAIITSTSGTQEISAGVTLGSNLGVAVAAGTLNLTGTVAETGGSKTLTKTGAGTLNFGVSSNLTGLSALAASNGVTNVNSVLGTGGTSTVSVSGATTLKFGSVSQTLSSLSIGAGSTVTFTSGLASFTGGGGGGKAPGIGGSAVVPEPGTLGLLLVGALGVLNRRRRA